MHLNLLPMPVVAALFVLGGLAVIGLIAAVAVRYTPWRDDEGAQDTALDMSKLIAGVLGLFLIFVLTQSMNYYREAEVATSREAGNLLQLDHSLVGVMSEYGKPAQALLREYVTSVIEREWPAMREGRLSPDTEQAETRLQLAVAEALVADPAGATLRNLQKNLDDVEDNRTARTGAAQSGVPGALWWIVSALFAVLAASLFLLDPRSRDFRVFSLYLCCLLLLASLLFMVDGPYRGDFSVSPAPLQRVLMRMAAP